MIVKVDTAHRKCVVTDVRKIEKYHEMGDPNDPFYPENFEGMPAIRISIIGSDDLEIFFSDTDYPDIGAKKARDLAYDNMVNQLESQNCESEQLKRIEKSLQELHKKVDRLPSYKDIKNIKTNYDGDDWSLL